MSKENEVPSAEDLKKAEELLPFHAIKVCTGKGGRTVVDDEQYEEKTLLNQGIADARTVLASALSALRASWEKERNEIVTELLDWKKVHSDTLVMYSVVRKEKQALEAEKKGLEERVREQEYFIGSLHNYDGDAKRLLEETVAENRRLKAKVAELTAELQATRKACDQAHQNTLDREEERDRLKAENVELRKTEDAVLGWTHPNFKWYADKIDSLTSRLSCALEALKKILRVCRLRKKWMNPTLAESELKKCTEEIEAESVLTSPDNLRMVEREPWYHADGTFEMLPVEKVKAMRIKAAAVIKAAREFCKVRVCCHWNPDTADEEKKNCMHPLSDALEALEAHEKGGGV